MPASVTIRMYNQNNLGDCFLLKFKDGAAESFILIDFGSYERGNEGREREIAESIKETVGSNPLTIVLTHQHKDHLSGFISAAATMQDMHVEDVWLSYLDDPTSKEAQTMREATEQFWKKNTEAKQKVRARFGEINTVVKMLDAKDAMDLFAEEQTGGEAIANLLQWCRKPPDFLLPGKRFDLPRLPDGSVKVYVLGPPTDAKLLRKLNPSDGEAVNRLDATGTMLSLDTSSNLMLDALNTVTTGKSSRQAEDFPFNKNFRHPLHDPGHTLLIKHHYETVDTWRQIDHEWLSEMGRLSLHMGNLTNNSSLVLAFELVAQKKVLLFVADAQIGNWKSWLDLKFDGTDVDAKDLLSRTVFYKAGHHSSHNATLAESLDLMNDEELVIMIPVNERVSSSRHFAMLKQGMLKGYNRKSRGRILRSDTIYHTPATTGVYQFPFALSERDFTPEIRIGYDRANESHLFIEYEVR